MKQIEQRREVVQLTFIKQGYCGCCGQKGLGRCGGRKQGDWEEATATVQASNCGSWKCKRAAEVHRGQSLQRRER